MSIRTILIGAAALALGGYLYYDYTSAESKSAREVKEILQLEPDVKVPECFPKDPNARLFAAAIKHDQRSKAELDTVRRAIECHYSQRNKLVDLLLSDDHMLFWMARSCYVRRDGTLNPPATDMLPELSSPRLRGEVGGGPA